MGSVIKLGGIVRAVSLHPHGVSDLHILQQEIGNLADAEPGVLIDILLSYRAISAWQSMIQLVDSLILYAIWRT